MHVWVRSRARVYAHVRAYMCIFVSIFEISMKLPFKRYKVCPNRTIINKVMGCSIFKVDLGLWYRQGHVAGQGTCGRVWGHIAGCGSMWQGSEYVVGGQP